DLSPTKINCDMSHALHITEELIPSHSFHKFMRREQGADTKERTHPVVSFETLVNQFESNN
ncbi:hypothetical protein L9F63_024621, partial [Diploptera punctata]